MLLSLIICKIILKSKLKLREYTVFSDLARDKKLSYQK